MGHRLTVRRTVTAVQFYPRIAVLRTLTPEDHIATTRLSEDTRGPYLPDGYPAVREITLRYSARYRRGGRQALRDF